MYHWRFGMAYDQDPTKRETRTPRLPTNDRIWLSMGFTYQMEEHMWLDFGYTHIWVKDGKVNSGPGSFGERTFNGNGVPSTGLPE